MPTVTRADIPLEVPEDLALFGLALAISRGDTGYHTSRAGGAWGMARETYGQPPTDAKAQAAIACKLWQDLRAGILRALPLDGTPRMLALAIVGWYAPGHYATAANKQTVRDILAAAHLSWLESGVNRAAPIVSAGWPRSGPDASPPSPPAREPPAESGEDKTAPASKKPGGFGWLVVLALGGFGAWLWWKYGRGAP